MGMSTLKSPRSESLQTTDSDLSWDVSIEDQETLNSDEQLSSLVRNSYMMHLKRCLIKNYEKWSESNRSDGDMMPLPFSETNVIAHAKNLEKKALRSCMLTSFYQKAMVQIISEIKQSTQKRILHNGFLDAANNCKGNACDKSIQTEDTQPNFYTELNEQSTLPLPELEHEPDAEPEMEPKILSTHDSVDSYEELLNMLTSPPPLPDESPLESLKRKTFNNDIGKSNNKRMKDLDFTNIGSQQAKPILEVNNRQPKKSKLDERLESFALLFGDSNDSSEIIKANEPLPNDVNGMCPPLINEKKTNDVPEVINNFPNKVIIEEQMAHKFRRHFLPVDWSVELTVQNFNLNKILSSLSPVKRAIVEKRFKDLFGSDIIQMVVMSEEEKTCCRKRTASFVVGELTPHYISGKISSRQLFKHLAKKITEQIMRKTYAADADLVKKDVSQVFEKVQQFNSLSDLSCF